MSSLKDQNNVSRRAMLKGSGVSCTLPFLPSLVTDVEKGERPKRLCYLYVPNGCSLPDRDDKLNAQWRWFPDGAGRDYKFTSVLRPLSKHREHISILGGLSHPLTRRSNGHTAADTWLTGACIDDGAFHNRISFDQVAANALSGKTPFHSMTLSIDGGVGYRTRSTSLSFNKNGACIPSEHNHRLIFERYFHPGGAEAVRARQQALARGSKVVDLVLGSRDRLMQRLSREDQYILDEYLADLNELEDNIAVQENHTRPSRSKNGRVKDISGFAERIDPNRYIRSMLDLIVLAYQADLTRVITYMMGREDGIGLAEHFPKSILGQNMGHHEITHSMSMKKFELWGKYDRWMAGHLAYLIDRLRRTRDEYGSILDSTIVTYGSASSTRHNARNCPTIVAGGESFGLKHGAYSVYEEHTHCLSRLFTTMLATAGIENGLCENTALAKFETLGA